MTGYRVITYQSLYSRYKVVELGDQIYGEWIIYIKGVPKYHINLFDEIHETNLIIKQKFSVDSISIQEFLNEININYRMNFHLVKKKLFSVKINSKIENFELPPLPMKYLRLKL